MKTKGILLSFALLGWGMGVFIAYYLRICDISIVKTLFCLAGPQCVLSCAKERRPFPKQGFTCCLAMDGVKLLASGFEGDEKVYQK